MYVLIGLLGLALLMVVHEGGHFLAARAFGMRVTKFSIGFGPPFFKIVPKDGYFWFTTAADKIKLRLWKHDPDKHGPTVYQVAMIPFLAYVQIAGMNPLEEADPKDKGSYANASIWGRIITIFGGPLSNYLFASVFFFFAFFLGGREATVKVNNEVQFAPYVSPLPGRPAAAAGFREGDKIIEIAGTPITTWDQMAEQISKRPGEPTKVLVERGAQQVTIEVTPATEPPSEKIKDDKPKGRIGVKPHRLPVPAKEAALLAVTAPPKVVKDFVFAIGQWIMRKVESDLSGPKRIIEDMAAAAERSTAEFLLLLGSISAYLGAFNLTPFPALDGGRLIFLGYEAVTRRKVNAKVEAFVNVAGFMMLFSLMIYVTIKDFGGFGPR